MEKISVPLEWIESLSRLRMPRPADDRMRELVRRKRETTLDEREEAELEILLEYNALIQRLGVEALNALFQHGPDADGTRVELRNGLPVIIAPEGTPPIDPEEIRRIREEEGF